MHLALDDATRDSAVVEFRDGRPRVHYDRTYTVMTHSPPLDQQQDHLKRYEGFDGALPLPGTTEAPTASYAPPTTSAASRPPTPRPAPTPP